MFMEGRLLVSFPQRKKWVTEPKSTGSVILCHVPPEGAHLTLSFFITPFYKGVKNGPESTRNGCIT